MMIEYSSLMWLIIGSLSSLLRVELGRREKDLLPFALSTIVPHSSMEWIWKSIRWNFSSADDRKTKLDWNPSIPMYKQFDEFHSNSKRIRWNVHPINSMFDEQQNEDQSEIIINEPGQNFCANSIRWWELFQSMIEISSGQRFLRDRERSESGVKKSTGRWMCRRHRMRSNDQHNIDQTIENLCSDEEILVFLFFFVLNNDEEKNFPLRSRSSRRTSNISTHFNDKFIIKDEKRLSFLLSSSVFCRRSNPTQWKCSGGDLFTGKERSSHIWWRDEHLSQSSNIWTDEKSKSIFSPLGHRKTFFFVVATSDSDMKEWLSGRFSIICLDQTKDQRVEQQMERRERKRQWINRLRYEINADLIRETGANDFFGISF